MLSNETLLCETFSIGSERIVGQASETNCGPLIDKRTVEKLEAHIVDPVQSGTTIMLGGTFFPPPVLTGVRQDMRIALEETFGPVVSVFGFHTEQEVIELENDTEFGFAAYFLTHDLVRSWRLGERLEHGIVGINTGTISAAETPFGGFK